MHFSVSVMRIQVDTTVLVEESGKLLLPSSHLPLPSFRVTLSKRRVRRRTRLFPILLQALAYYSLHLKNFPKTDPPSPYSSLFKLQQSA